MTAELHLGRYPYSPHWRDNWKEGWRPIRFKKTKWVKGFWLECVVFSFSIKLNPKMDRLP